MHPRKNFENFHAVMVILVLFLQFLGKFCLKFLTLILSASPIMMHFVGTLSIMPALRHNRYRKGLKLWKNSVHHEHF